jgi:Xaa-Pro aminopeptidase
MDVHDVGRTDQPLRPGEVFTIEPGLYLPAEGFGVRIEDDYLMTPDSLEKLSEAIPSEPGAVERWIEKAQGIPQGRFEGIGDAAADGQRLQTDPR